MGKSEVVYEDLGLSTLAEDAGRLLENVVVVTAKAVESNMKDLIKERGFVRDRTTVNSVQVDPPQDRLVRDIGPTTHYAIYGELGYHITHVYGRKLKEAIRKPGLHFARDALFKVQRDFENAIGTALSKLGGR